MQNRPRTNVSLREMQAHEICMIAQVDRSERVEAKYVAARSPDGMGLALRRVEIDPPQESGPWSREGINRRIAEWKPQIEKGGLLFGAFCGRRLIGFAVLGPPQKDGYAELSALFVDARHRRLGIGSLLMDQLEGQARHRGLRALWIASNRTISAVEFYLKRGCKVVSLSDNSTITHLRGAPRFIKELR